MPTLRLLAPSLLASSLFASAFALSAAGQSHPTPATPNPTPLAIIAVPPLFSLDTTTPPSAKAFSIQPAPPGTFTFKSRKPSTTIALSNGKFFKVPADDKSLDSLKAKSLDALQKRLAELAREQSPCFTLRSYNFTRQDLKSDHPHSSSEIDCTPASKVHILSGPLTSNDHPSVRPASTVPISANPK
ncbi:MAG: hypothetical protein WBY53_10825 [Acidobacteriaceae bacterium]